MTTFTLTGCHEHPQQLDLTDDCMTCSVIMSYDMDTAIVDTSDKFNSVYPEIDARIPAGLVGFVNSPKKLNKFQAPVAKMFTSFSKPIILNTFYISRDFHPGQSEIKGVHYPERFALGEEDYSERFGFTQEELRIPQPYRKILPTKRQTKKVKPAPTSAPTSAPTPAPPTPSSVAEQLKQLISNEDLEALVKQYIANQLQSTKANSSEESTKPEEGVGARIPEPEESEAKEDTIVVDVPSDSSDSEDDKPITPRNKPSRFLAAKDELLAALLTESDNNNQKSKKGKKTSPTRSVAQATKDLTSNEESHPATRTRSAKRARSTESSEYEARSSKRSRSPSPESTDEPPARSTRSSKRSKQSECSDKDTRESKSQTRKMRTMAPPSRSLRLRGRV